MLEQLEQTLSQISAGDLLDNPELLEKEAIKIGEMFKERAYNPHDMNKGIKTAKEFGEILDESFDVDWTKFCNIGKEDF